MSDECNRVEVEVPAGTLVVRHARCPKGCDLMDAAVEIRGVPSIHLAYELRGEKGHIHLDPAYGRFENVSDREIPEGSIVQFSCPACGASLQDPQARCSACSAPMFMIHLPKGGFVEGCLRKGCIHHRLRLVTTEQMMQRLFDPVGMDIYL